MPPLAKARRRDAKRVKQQQMTVDGRGLMTAVPNWGDRKKRETRRRLARR